MERFIIQKLIKWQKSIRRKPLIIRGARQVGKTWAIKSFGNTYFEGKLHLVDFEKHPDWHRIFEKDFDIKRIIYELEFVMDTRIEPGKDLLFFDEIQTCPKAIMSLRYFYEDFPQMHVIAAGSLLEFALSKISFPVGRIQFLKMFPLSFREFLLAVNKNKLADFIHEENDKPSDIVHDLILRELSHYFFVGGMPECVKAFVDTGKLKDVQEIQKQLIETYRADFAKYKPQVDAFCLNAALTFVAKSVGQKIKYTRLSDAFSQPTNKKAFELLAMAGLIHKIPSASPSGLPLGASEGKSIKAILVDIGLMQNLVGLNISEELSKQDLLAIYRGALAEQFTGQEMLAAGQDNLYHWSREAKNSSAEVDYLIEKNGKIYPIEIKSGVAGKLKSLHLLLKTFSNISHGIILSERMPSEIKKQKLIFTPLYFASKMVAE